MEAGAETAVEAGGVAFSGDRLRDLYFRPGRFFQAGLPLGDRSWLIPVLLMLGVSEAQGEIDAAVMRAELGMPRPGWSQLEPLVLGSWSGYWLMSLAAGLLAAAFAWYIGGWWYGLRVRWSGAPDRDPRRARVIYVWAGLVLALPSLVYMLGCTLFFPDYATAWASEDLVAILLLVFPFWSVVVSYRAVRSEFPVKAWRARIWFLVLPVAGYLLVFVGVGASYLGAGA